ncbi:MAG: hypothetical protein H6821_09155 [Planctomycetaceae bacterium]|nr:hypothetical protein [Planctomycetales bacterium]MCB9874331.1 hypothetical protein [Planctomycetaceae bacterium]MCB9941542.1 hypothetical protein [Planctomycetaceae bacterium]
MYNLPHDEAGVSPDIRHDTAELAVALIRRWWKRMSRKR